MKFGVREIVDVVFKATADGQKIGDKTFKKYQPVFMIDTATTSSLEQATTTVYAQGGKGYNRLIAWEGEKTMTFTVTDALMSPMGLAVLTGAGLITPNKSNQAHVHSTINAYVDENGEATISLDDLNQEMGLDAISYDICNTIDMFATELDGSGAGINWFGDVSIKGATDEYVKVTKDTSATFVVSGAKNITVQLDFYVIMNNAVTEVHIEPGSFGGYFYIEAQTLFRREDSGKDMAAELIIPKAKVQSAFTFTMAASGDPSTFDFVMDAFPGYTRFDSTTKKMCVIQIVGVDKAGEEDSSAHSHKNQDTNDSPDFNHSVTPKPSFDISGTAGIDGSDVPSSLTYQTELAGNQAKITVTSTENSINIAASDTLTPFAIEEGSDPKAWVVIDVDTGKSDITAIKYNGANLTATDVAEATSYGLGAGHFVLKVDTGVTPQTFTLAADDMETTTITVTVA
jgi:hypothetical protein